MAPAVEVPAEVVPEVASVPAPAAVVADESRVPAILAIVTLGAIGAALWWLSTQPQRAPRLLGSVGGGATVVTAAVPQTTTAVRGLGRFARPRTAPPRAI